MRKIVSEEEYAHLASLSSNRGFQILLGIFAEEEATVLNDIAGANIAYPLPARRLAFWQFLHRISAFLRETPAACQAELDRLRAEFNNPEAPADPWSARFATPPEE